MGFISSPLRATQRDLWVCLPGTYLDSNQRRQLSQASSVTYTPNSPDKSRPSIGRFHNLGPFADDARQDCRWCDHVSVSQQSEINARPLGQSSVLGRIDKVEASCWSRLLSEHIARAFVRLAIRLRGQECVHVQASSGHSRASASLWRMASVSVMRALAVVLQE
jgi:hypothetical protein